jgi:hypothetical protein
MINYNYIQHRTDIYLIKAIKIHKKYDLNNFKIFEILIYSNSVWSIPFEFLLKLSTITTTTTHNIINIPKQIYSNLTTFSGFPLYLLPSGGRVNISSISNKYRCQYSLIETNTLINSNIKREYINKNNGVIIKEPLNQYESITFTDSKDIHMYCHDRFDNSAGIFITINKALKYIQFTVNKVKIFEYNSDLINEVGQVIKKCIWTRKKEKALHRSLIKYLPTDVINEISKHASKYREYTYWIPFVPYNKWNGESIDGINLCHFGSRMVIDFDSKYTGSICFKNHSNLNICDDRIVY